MCIQYTLVIYYCDDYGVSVLPQTSTGHSFSPNRTRHIILLWLLESSSS